MPGILQKAKDDHAAGVARRYADKSAEDVMPSFPYFLNNPPPVQFIEKEGRPTIKFIDVGGKFLDVDERKQRMKDAKRRRSIKDKKRAAKRSTKRAKVAQ